VVRSGQIDIIHALPTTRVVAFVRRSFAESLLIVASLNNAAFADGYVIETAEARLPSGAWREIFNSDSDWYGGNNLGNFGTAIPAVQGSNPTAHPRPRLCCSAAGVSRLDASK
jgi:1,4-alpha-glucan branching enzyme